MAETVGAADSLNLALGLAGENRTPGGEDVVWRQRFDLEVAAYSEGAEYTSDGNEAVADLVAVSAAGDG